MDQRLSSSFGTVAAAYAEHRPDYARDAVRWALAPAPGRRVLDLGAGTGKLTTVLASVGAEVVAVEPDPAMLAELRLPGVRTLAGSAERIPLPDGSVDAVLAGHSMHWFDLAVAGPEIARVLAPGGVLAGLWNVYDDRVGWVASLARVGGPAAVGARDLLSSWRASTVGLRPPGFSEGEQAEFTHGQVRTAESLVAGLATRAGVVVMPASEREATLARIRSFLSAMPGEFTLPMRTGVLRLRRA
nr:class I SAM-dependent methyltransferase [Cryptosporangium phraense]